MSRGWSVWVAACAALMACAPVAAPSAFAAPPTATLVVMVVDPTGAFVPGATVTLVDADGLVRETVSSERGEAAVADLRPGDATLKVEAAGFAPVLIEDLRLKGGRNWRRVQLVVAGYAELLTVTRDREDSRLAEALGSTLTPEQIAQLSDDPDEMEQQLRDLAGPGAVLRVDGFRGGRLPPKDQIREIRIRMDPYAAELHEPGHPMVDIITKPGIGVWRSNVSMGFRDESLNARNAMAASKAPEQTRRFGWTLDGPLVRDRTSFSLNVDGTSAFEARTIRALTPSGAVSGLARQPVDRLNITGRVDHTLNASHTFRAEVSRETRAQDSLGVGDFDLEERGYDVDQSTTTVRMSDVGSLGRKAVNQLKVQIRWQDLSSAPVSAAPAVRVLDAFSAGGAQIRGRRRSRHLDVEDNFDWAVGRHALRAGVLFEGSWYESDEQRDANGVFTFSSLAAFAAGRPTTYQQRVGDPFVAYARGQFAAYVEDELRLRRNLQLSVGLRHEMQTQLDDRLNFGPRLGLTWSPFRHGRSIVRLGAGLFNDWYGATTYEETLRVNGEQQQELLVFDPGYPDPFAAGSRLPAAPTRIVQGRDLEMPGAARASIGLDQQMGSLRAMVNVWTESGAHQWRSVNVNAPVDGRRPDPSLGNVLELQSSGRTRSRGVRLGVNLMERDRGLFASVFYMLSREQNHTDDPLSLPADSARPDAEWGPARDDIRHRFIGFVSARLPRGFRAGTSWRLESGAPYTVTTGFDANGDGVSNDRPDGVGRHASRGDSRAFVDARLSWGRGFGHRPTPPGGPTARILRLGPDSDVLGSVGGGPVDEARWRFEIYAQAFNVLNVTNATSYAGVLTSPFFGQPRAALAPRRIETGIKVSF